MSIGKSKGPATLGRVPVAHKRMQSGLGFISQFNPDFRPLRPDDGNELIAYEETDPAIMRLRKMLERELRFARSSFRTLQNLKMKEWKRAMLEEKRTRVKQLKAAILAKRVKYAYAEISIDPSCVGDPLNEVAIANLWKTSTHGGHLRHRSLLRPADFQMLFHCSKYKVNNTFRRTQYGPAGKITRNHDNVPSDATGEIWSYISPFRGSERYIVGWYRHHSRIRRLTAKEQRKMLKDLNKQRFSALLRDEMLVQWLGAHPRPDRSTDAELSKLWDNIQKLEREVSGAIRFQRCSHTKVEFHGYTAETLARVPFGFGVDYAEGQLPVYNPARRYNDDPSQDVRCVEELVFPIFGGTWENTYCNKLVRVPGTPQWRLLETTLGSLIENGGNFVDISAYLADGQFRTSTRSKAVTLQTFDNDYVPPVTIPEHDRSQILTACLRQANKIEGLVFGRESGDRLARSIVECKDLPQTAGQVGSFVRWLACGLPLAMDGMPPLQGAAKTRVLAAQTARAAAAAWLFWKFGVEPTAHDINNLCSGTGNYLQPMRAGLTSMYRSLEQIRWDMTFKMKHKWKESGVTDVMPVNNTLRTMWIHLPCLPMIGSSSHSPWPTGFRPDAGLVALPEQTKVCTDSYARPTATCANGCVILSELANRLISQSDWDTNLDWLEAQIQEILFPVCTSTAWKTLDTNVFARFDADDIAAAYGWNGDGLSDLYGIHRALTTSWEVMPLSFIADWFLSTREVMSALDLRAFLREEGLRLKPLDGVWLGHRFQYWNTVQWPRATVTKAYVGTFDGLAAHGVPGLPESWRGRSMTTQVTTAAQAGYPNTTVGWAYSSTELRALSSWWGGPHYDPDPESESHYPWNVSDVALPVHMPILSLEIAVSTTADQPSRVCGKGTCYQRYQIDGSLRPLAFVPVFDTKVNAGKMISLAALISNLVKTPKGVSKIRFSPVARFLTRTGP